MSGDLPSDGGVFGGLLLGALLAGAIGGALVVGIAIAVLGIVSGFKLSTTTTVSVRESRVPASTVSRTESGLSAGQIYESDAPGVVFVNASGVTASQSASEYLNSEGGEQATATAAGFEIDRSGDILTNWHAVEGSSKITVGIGDSHTVTAQLVGEDPSHDLALLRVPVAGVTLNPLVLGDSDAVKVGDGVLAIGNPFGLGGTLTTGVISALNRQITAPDGTTISGVLQTDTPVNPGNSGGPLVNGEGQVIGINSQIETSGNRGGSVGIAFAIPVDVAKRDLSKLGGHR